jgi:mono/diheme cytochrome c family protein
MYHGSKPQSNANLINSLQADFNGDFARHRIRIEVVCGPNLMKASASRWSVVKTALAVNLMGGSFVWGQAAPPILPPQPPGAPLAQVTTPGFVPRRPIPTNPVANPFVFSASPAGARTPPTPTPLAPPAAPVPTALPPITPQLSPALVMQPADPSVVTCDAELKEYTSKPGEMNASFQFWLTNVSSSDVLINNVRTSCGCTVAKLPSYPWRISPGGAGPIDVTVNLAGKGGTISKGVTVESSAGVKMLTVKVNITPAIGQANGAMGDTERLKNMQMALADRQVVFKKQECATCHADPAKGKIAGVQIYAAVCSVCHDSLHRAAMVSNLRQLDHPTDADHWRKWVMYGRAGSMMPAFAKSEGGPLDDQQIDALVDYMVKAFPSRVRPAGQAAAPAAPTGAAQPVSVFPAPKLN